MCKQKTQTTEISIVTNNMKFIILSDNKMKIESKDLMK